MSRKVPIPHKRSKLRKEITTPYRYVSADYKDFDEFIDDLVVSLARLGIQCIRDPAYDGTDMNGIILSPVSIDPKLVYAEYIQMTGCDPVGENSYKYWKEGFDHNIEESMEKIRKLAPRKVGDMVRIALDPIFKVNRKWKWKITKIHPTFHGTGELEFIYTLKRGTRTLDIRPRYIIG